MAKNLPNEEKKPIAKKVWFLLGLPAFATIIAIVGLAVTMVQNGILSKGGQKDTAAMLTEAVAQNEKAATLVSLQEEQNNILRDLVSLEENSVNSGPSATSIAEQKNSLESTVQVLDKEINILTTSIASGIEGTLSPRVMPAIEQTSTPEAIEPAYIDNAIPFSDPDSQDVLLESWKWMKGEAENSEYRIVSNNLTLVAGPHTILQDRRQSAPQVEYQVSGNFQVYVKLNFDPIERDQMAGIGLRSPENPDTWIALRRGYYWNQRIDVLRNTKGEPQEVVNIPYIKKSTCLLIRRQNENISFAVSENCRNWVDIKTNFTFPLPDTVNIFLFTYSTTSNGISAEFSDLITSEPTERNVTIGNGYLSFFDDNIMLNEMWSWFPGGSETDIYQMGQNSETLSIIAGPQINLSQNTAPRVMILTSGNFTADVSLSFDPIERDQVAGIGIASPEDLNNWFVARRAYYWEQRVDLNQRMNGNEVYIFNTPYTEKEIQLRLQRDGNLINIYYSGDGASWTPMAENYVMSFPDQVYIFLYAYSTTQRGVLATFSGFSLSHR